MKNHNMTKTSRNNSTALNSIAAAVTAGILAGYGKRKMRKQRKKLKRTANKIINSMSEMLNNASVAFK